MWTSGSPCLQLATSRMVVTPSAYSAATASVIAASGMQ